MVASLAAFWALAAQRILRPCWSCQVCLWHQHQYSDSAFKHVAVSQGASCKGYSYQIDIIDKDGNYKSYTDGSDCGNNKVSISDAYGCTGMEPLKEYKPIITVKYIDFTDVKKVAVRYFPRHNALGAQNDTYSDVYATWDISCLFGL